jgi:hypothetical protein
VNYNRLIIPVVLVITLLPMMVSCGQKSDSAKSDVSLANVPENFVGEERVLVGKLFEMWTKKGHVATVDQAAEALGVTASDSVRADLLAKFEQNLNVHERLGRYGACIFILTNEEKLICQYIVTNEKKNQEFPAVDKIAADLKLSQARVLDRLKFLAALDLFYDLGGPDEYNKLGFSYGHKLGEFTFDLGFHQHVFRVDGGKPFNVGCAKEALFIAATEYAKSRIEYRTYDPLTLEPITVEFVNGEITSVTPETARLLEGGTCGTNDLYVSEENAKAAAATMPKFQTTQAPIHDVKQRFEDVKKQAAESK